MAQESNDLAEARLTKSGFIMGAPPEIACDDEARLGLFRGHTRGDWSEQVEALLGRRPRGKPNEGPVYR